MLKEKETVSDEFCWHLSNFVDGWGHGNSNCYLKADSTESKVNTQLQSFDTLFLHWASWIFIPILPYRSQQFNGLVHCSTGLKTWNPHEGCMQISCVKRLTLNIWASEMSTSSMAVKMVQLYWKCHLEQHWSWQGGKDGGDDGIQWWIVTVYMASKQKWSKLKKNRFFSFVSRIGSLNQWKSPFN